MDPWLEDHHLWLDLHNSLITSIRDAIVPKVAPNTSWRWNVPTKVAPVRMSTLAGLTWE